MQHGKPLMARIRFIDGKIRDGKYPNARTLADEYEVSERTIHRDIEYMRDMLDCPIEYDKKRRGFYYSEPAFALPNVSIKESELFALCVAEKALEQYRGTPLYATLAAVFEKILGALPDEAHVHYAWLNPDVTFIQRSYTNIDYATWESVSTALYTRTLLRISHRKAGSDEATERIVEPYHMVSYDGEWYLIAYCRLRGQVLIFAVSRILSCEQLKDTFDRPVPFDLKEYLGDNFGITIEEEAYCIEIEFMPEAAPYVRERVWREGQKIIELPNGGIVLSFTVNSLREMKNWVLGWGSRARVLSPQVLVDEVKRDLQDMTKNYIL
jgi:predicted DNA-binding transcriptional regulator YafY